MPAADSAGRSLDTEAGKKEPWAKEQEAEKANAMSSEDAGGYLYTPSAHAGRRERDAVRELKRFATTTTAARPSILGLANSPAHDAMWRTKRYRMLQ